MSLLKTSICFGLSFLLATPLIRGEVRKDFFFQPKFISEEELINQVDSRSIAMRWNTIENHYLHFETTNKDVHFEIVLKDCVKEFASKYKMVTQQKGNSTRLVYSYRLDENDNQEVNHFPIEQEELELDSRSYVVSERRILKDVEPQHLDLQDLEQIILNHNVLFYTGAGISSSAGIPSMKELIDFLELDRTEGFIFFVDKVITDPKKFATKMKFFHRNCLYSQPTKAHASLKNLADYKNCQIVTENLDCLHERTGILPYRIDATHLRDEIGIDSLTKIEYIICIGLSFDDKGFLGWFKQNNSQGKIIAIDLRKPSYLGEEDFLCLGDLQIIIPFLEQKIVAENK